ncbi:MAG: cupin domain-containing protein [Halobacteria archaeon]|nr:cupin domain-containing protein [Halobacteria archaeon]
MGYKKASTDDVDSVVPDEWGGMWFLKGELDTQHIGFTVLELEPGGKGKEHDHSEDGQEEVYYVAEGQIDIELGDGDGDGDEVTTVTLQEDEAIRVDAEETRQLHNRGDKRAKLVIVGAPL